MGQESNILNRHVDSSLPNYSLYKQNLPFSKNMAKGGQKNVDKLVKYHHKIFADGVRPQWTQMLILLDRAQTLNSKRL